ncbi:protease modulator HflC [Psychrilyobacter atlanticus]|uniref:protease modulator HflC n=1 Tax=Psychrilyobacter atlanticus TaxID=271091 RepID=UPI0004118C60|nr:protease modulator HflC [Psychrilyobacter atlanticus]
MKKLIISILAIVVIVSSTSLFQVSEVENAVVIRLGKPKRVVTEPGLYGKVPFIDDVRYFDKRLLNYDAAPKGIIIKEKKSIVIDNYARWKIADPLLFLQSVQNIAGAQARLDDIVYSELRREMGKYTLSEIISSKRDIIMENVTEESKKIAKSSGIDIIDVRIKRVELPKENEQNIYKRMEAERNQQAKKYRAEGREKALEITSQADQEKTIILAEAYRKSEELKGEGDAKALEIYADAYNRDPEFYKFMKTLESYEKIMDNKTKVILSTDSELWKMLQTK